MSDFYLVSLRMPSVKKTKNAGKAIENQRNSYILLVKIKMTTAIVENSIGVSQKTKQRINI